MPVRPMDSVSLAVGPWSLQAAPTEGTVIQVLPTALPVPPIPCWHCGHWTPELWPLGCSWKYW